MVKLDRKVRTLAEVWDLGKNKRGIWSKDPQSTVCTVQCTYKEISRFWPLKKILGVSNLEPLCMLQRPDNKAMKPAVIMIEKEEQQKKTKNHLSASSLLYCRWTQYQFTSNLVAQWNHEGLLVWISFWIFFFCGTFASLKGLGSSLPDNVL